MDHINIISRRKFFDRSIKTGLGVALGTLTDIPLVVKRALAEGNIGLNGKKLLFIWLRGANDGLNSLVPIQDSAYGASIRPDIYIPKDPGADYSVATGSADFPINAASEDPTYGYPYGIRLGNGFAALHPSLKFLAPVFNAGELSLIHRVGYPDQTRSHFDSQKYWENGMPRNNIVNNGILYRAMYEAIQASPDDVALRALTGVSIQSSLPLILRGSEAAMTNLSDPRRYDLLGVPNNENGQDKAESSLNAANDLQFVSKKSRNLLRLQYANMSNTLEIFAGIDFEESGNNFQDDVATDNDSAWAAANGGGYYLFPTTADKNGGWRRPDGSADGAKYAVPIGAQNFFGRLKAASLILNKTEAMVAGVEFGGFDTHNNQGGVTGKHSDLQRQIGWSMYALKKYFENYADQAAWENVVVVTLSEFGRTTVQNSNVGTDHAEGSAMFVAGGGVNGGVYNCGTTDTVPWITGPADQGGGVDGSMFGVNNRYVKRASDYRSILGEIIRKHLGATSGQLGRIIPGYADAGEFLQSGGTSAIDGTPITGELGLL